MAYHPSVPSQNTKIDDSGNLANNIALEEKNIIVI